MAVLRKLIAAAVILLGALPVAAQNAEPADSRQQELADLTLEDNIMSPEVPQKYAAAVKSYMAREAKALQKLSQAPSNLDYRLETMRGGQVVIVTIPCSKLFAANDTALLASADKELRPFLAYFRTPGKFKVLMALHTDDTGSGEYLFGLAEKRIISLYDYFDENAADTGLLMGYPIGPIEPLKPNSTRQNREENRRLEIFIVPGELLIEQAKAGRL